MVWGIKGTPVRSTWRIDQLRVLVVNDIMKGVRVNRAQTILSIVGQIK